MRGRTLRLDGDEEPWAGSSARYRIATGDEGTRLTVVVSCVIEGLPFAPALWALAAGSVEVEGLIGGRIKLKEAEKALEMAARSGAGGGAKRWPPPREAR